MCAPLDSVSYRFYIAKTAVGCQRCRGALHAIARTAELTIGGTLRSCRATPLGARRPPQVVQRLERGVATLGQLQPAAHAATIGNDCLASVCRFVASFRNRYSDEFQTFDASEVIRIACVDGKIVRERCRCNHRVIRAGVHLPTRTT